MFIGFIVICICISLLFHLSLQISSALSIIYYFQEHVLCVFCLGVGVIFFSYNNIVIYYHTFTGFHFNIF